jgi:hypothetical protein
MKLIDWGLVRTLIYTFYRGLGVKPDKILKAMEQIPQLKLDKDD